MNIPRLLLEEKAISLNPSHPFRYTSGILSPIYCDNRILLTKPSSRKQIVEGLIGLIEDDNIAFDVIAGIATAGIAWGALIAERLDKPFIYVRPEKKEHGKQSAIEGRLDPYQIVLPIEDLISTSGSVIKAIYNVREENGIVNDCGAIFTYGMKKSKEAFAAANCNLRTLTDLSMLMAYALDRELINSEEQSIISDWINDPTNWGKKYGFG